MEARTAVEKQYSPRGTEATGGRDFQDAAGWSNQVLSFFRGRTSGGWYRPQSGASRSRFDIPNFPRERQV